MNSRLVQAGEEGDKFQTIYPGTSQKKAFTNASSQSAAVGANTTVVRVIASQDCHILIGANPTAVADGTGTFMKAGIPEYFGILPASKIAVIRDSADGNLFITEGS